MRYIAWSHDGGHTWEDMSLSDELPDGDQDRDYGLMAGLVRLPVDGHDILIYSNIDSPSGRANGTVWASFDGGKHGRSSVLLRREDSHIHPWRRDVKVLQVRVGFI
jgi:hypothetical protein